MARSRWTSALRGHLWTIAPLVRHELGAARAALRREAPAESSPWSVTVDDPTVGPVRLHGRLSGPAESDALLVIVHGLGGDAESHYVHLALAAARRAGVRTLRLNLRGAGGEAGDYYHAGLGSDLGAALASPELARHRHVYVLGYSIGGHVTLRHATSGAIDPRLRAVAAICPPLDLDLSCRAIDAPSKWVYRRHVLRGLKRMLADVGARRQLHVAPAAVAAVTTLREWDRLVVAPRWGFSSAEHYYEEASVGPRLGDLAVPALVIESELDPMVLAETVRPSLASAPAHLEARWYDDAGHVGFPPGVDVERDAIEWLLRHRGDADRDRLSTSTPP
jgi:uncharacterized protein